MDSGTLGLLLKISRLVGLAPYKHAPDFQVSRNYVIIGRIFIIFNAFIGFLCDVGFCVLIHYQGVTAKHVIKIIGLSLITVMNTIGMITAPARLINMGNYLKKLNQIDAKLQNKKDLLSTSIYKFTILFGGYFMLRLVDLVMSLSKSQWVLTSAIINMIFSHFVVNLFIGSLLQLQIVFFVQRVNKTLIAINSTLRTILINKVNVRRAARDNDGKTNDNEESIPHRIREIALSYRFTSQIVTKTTKADGLIMLLGILYMAFHLEIHLYPILATIISNFILIDYLNYIKFSFWCASCLFFMIYYFEQFHCAHSEMQRTYNLIVSRKSTENDIEVEHELELFYRMLILSHAKYSPLSMCTFEISLMLKLLGCLITYLVIILQYGPEIKNVMCCNNETNHMMWSF